MTHLILTKWGYRDAKTGRWAAGPKKLWRFNYGLTFTLHGEYYGAIIQAWAVKRILLEQNRTLLVVKLQRAVADFLGYDYGDLWYVKSDGEGLQEVPYNRELEGWWEWWVEDDKGRSLKHDRGKL